MWHGASNPVVCLPLVYLTEDIMLHFSLHGSFSLNYSLCVLPFSILS